MDEQKEVLTPVKLFYAYARKDEELRSELEKHLSILHRQGLISSWHDRQIVAGTDFAKDIGTHLATASLILLLVSSDFLASDYCYSVEMKRALERHQANEARVIPILLRPVAWKGAPFEHLQVLPTDAKPVTSWTNQDEAFADIAAGIHRVIEDLSLLPASAPRTALPSVWNIPYPRNPVFTGREDLLQRLADTLKTGQATALSQPQAISGLGGIGKTQIAVEYAYLHRNEYKAVLWTLADTRESLISGSIAIARQLNLPEKDARDQAITIEAVKRWLQNHSSWLLILDNADELRLVREFIPTAFDGHILLTTREQSMGRLAKRIEVETMSQDVGALFLLRRAGLVTENASLDVAPSSDVRIAREICQELGGLPLALDQAGAYIEETGCGLSEYQKLYQHHQKDLLQRRGGQIDDHPEPVATTWALSFEKVGQASSLATKVLHFCAFLAPDAIPEELLVQTLIPEQQVTEGVSREFDEALAVLRRYSLIQRQAQGHLLQVHRLVQVVVRDAMEQQERTTCITRMISVMNKLFPWGDFENWKQCERYLSQALMCAEWMRQKQLFLQDGANLCNNAGRYFSMRAQYTQAELLFQQALAIFKQNRMSGHRQAAAPLHNLAILYHERGQYIQAEPLYQQALAILKRSWGPSHPEVASVLHNLADLYREQGKYVQAEPLLQQALHIRERSLGPKHLWVANALDTLAQLYQAQEKYAQAEPLYLRALGILEQNWESGRPLVGITLTNLANLYFLQGKLAQAESLYQQAFAVLEQSLGSEHPHVALALGGLANVYALNGKLVDAEPLYLRALSILEQNLGPEHPRTQNMRKNHSIWLNVIKGGQ